MSIRSVYAGVEQGIDYRLNQLDLEQDSSLESLVIISLFTDRRDNTVPADFKRGWWADSINSRPLGSRLWTLEREKQTPQLLLTIKHIAEEALLWLLDEGLVSRIMVAVDNVRRGVVGLSVTLFREGAKESYQYQWGAYQ